METQPPPLSTTDHSPRELLPSSHEEPNSLTESSSSTLTPGTPTPREEYNIPLEERAAEEIITAHKIKMQLAWHEANLKRYEDFSCEAIFKKYSLCDTTNEPLEETSLPLKARLKAAEFMLTIPECKERAIALYEEMVTQLLSFNLCLEGSVLSIILSLDKRAYDNQLKKAADHLFVECTKSFLSLSCLETMLAKCSSVDVVLPFCKTFPQYKLGKPEVIKTWLTLWASFEQDLKKRSAIFNIDNTTHLPPAETLMIMQKTACDPKAIVELGTHFLKFGYKKDDCDERHIISYNISQQLSIIGVLKEYQETKGLCLIYLIQMYPKCYECISTENSYTSCVRPPNPHQMLDEINKYIQEITGDHYLNNLINQYYKNDYRIEHPEHKKIFDETKFHPDRGPTKGSIKRRLIRPHFDTAFVLYHLGVFTNTNNPFESIKSFLLNIDDPRHTITGIEEPIFSIQLSLERLMTAPSCYTRISHLKALFEAHFPLSQLRESIAVLLKKIRISNFKKFDLPNLLSLLDTFPNPTAEKITALEYTNPIESTSDFLKLVTDTEFQNFISAFSLDQDENELWNILADKEKPLAEHFHAIHILAHFYNNKEGPQPKKFAEILEGLALKTLNHINDYLSDEEDNQQAAQDYNTLHWLLTELEGTFYYIHYQVILLRWMGIGGKSSMLWERARQHSHNDHSFIKQATACAWTMLDQKKGESWGDIYNNIIPFLIDNPSHLDSPQLEKALIEQFDHKDQKDTQRLKILDWLISLNINPVTKKEKLLDYITSCHTDAFNEEAIVKVAYIQVLKDDEDYRNILTHALLERINNASESFDIPSIIKYADFIRGPLHNEWQANEVILQLAELDLIYIADFKFNDPEAQEVDPNQYTRAWALLTMPFENSLYQDEESSRKKVNSLESLISKKAISESNALKALHIYINDDSLHPVWRFEAFIRYNADTYQENTYNIEHIESLSNICTTLLLKNPKHPSLNSIMEVWEMLLK